jgi:hypothetical protein
MGNVKFKKLVQILGLPRPYVRGLLELMWDVANECGNPVLGDPLSVEAAAEWPGEAKQLFRALSKARLIEQDEHGLWQIHDYWDHAPVYVQRRAEREAERSRRGETIRTLRRKAARARWEQEKDMQTDANDSRLHAKGATHNTKHPSPNPQLTTLNTTTTTEATDESAGKPVGIVGRNDLLRLLVEEELHKAAARRYVQALEPECILLILEAYHDMVASGALDRNPPGQLNKMLGTPEDYLDHSDGTWRRRLPKAPPTKADAQREQLGNVLNGFVKNGEDNEPLRIQ